MKQYRITVNGKSYDVTVEELNGARPAAAGGAMYAAPAAETAPAATPANGGSVTTVKAPMPGTVIAFKVIVGQQVKRGDVLLLLEAMKMENEIVAPQDGTVAALRVPASAAVNTGDALVELA